MSKTTRKPKTNDTKKVGVFLGSAKETVHVLHEFVKQVKAHKITKKKYPDLTNLWRNGRTSLALGDHLMFQSWDDPDTWASGVATITDVLKAGTTNDIAIFFLGNEDVILSRQRMEKLTRPNIWLEIGVFMARLGPEKTLLLDSGGFPWGEGHIPSDLFGITRKGYIGSKGFDFASAISQLATLILPIADKKNDPKGPQVDYKIEAQVILGRRNCYDHGIALTKGAKHALYSILSYPEEAVDGEQTQMQNAIVQALKNTSLTDIRRWIDFGNTDFLKQAYALKAEATKVQKWTDGKESDFQIIQTTCKHVEAIVSDDTALLVFPDYQLKKSAKRDDQVGLGVRVQHPEFAARLKAWCLRLVGAKEFKKGAKHVLFPPNSLPPVNGRARRSPLKNSVSSKKRTSAAKP